MTPHYPPDTMCLTGTWRMGTRFADVLRREEVVTRLPRHGDKAAFGHLLAWREIDAHHPRCPEFTSHSSHHAGK